MANPNADTMKGYGFFKKGDHEEVLQEVTIPKPKAEGRDLLVKVLAAATNPVDVKVIGGFTDGTLPRIVGWDAAGVVEAVGPEVTLFKVGDEVYFAGAIHRPGAYAEYTAVDERIVGRKPKSLNWEQAATVPLVGITVWESLFEECGVKIPTTPDEEKHNSSKVFLVVGGAGGVGTLAIQVAKKLLKLTVVATATRPESIAHCKHFGADYVFGHKTIVEEFKQAGLAGADYVLNCDVPKSNFDQLVEVLKPFGVIVNTSQTNDNDVNIGKLQGKRGALRWEFMFARPLHGIEPERQHALLNKLADLLDQGVLKHPHSKTYPFTLDGLRQALTHQKSGKAVGKLALAHTK